MLDIHPLPVPRPELAVALGDLALRWGRSIVVPMFDPDALARIDLLSGALSGCRPDAADHVLETIRPVVPRARWPIVRRNLAGPEDYRRRLGSALVLAGPELDDLGAQDFLERGAGWGALRRKVRDLVTVDAAGPGWRRVDRESDLFLAELPAAPVDLAGCVDREELVRRIVQRSGRLSPLELEVLVGHVAGDAEAAIADRLGLAASTVRVALWRARRKVAGGF